MLRAVQAMHSGLCSSHFRLRFLQLTQPPLVRLPLPLPLPLMRMLPLLLLPLLLILGVSPADRMARRSLVIGNRGFDY